MAGPASNAILVVNAGSSSVKFSVFGADLGVICAGLASEIGGDSRLRVNGAETQVALTDHRSAINVILEMLDRRGLGAGTLRAATHRIVHGGRDLTLPCRITPEIRAAIAACSNLAPLHNPPSLAAVDAIAELAPDLPQCASFDTGFHASNPPEARTYSLPEEWRNSGLQRYGFHGISYRALIDGMPKPLPNKLLALHLGNGASLCAIENGQSVATTMGYSPVSGLSMGSRVGDIDALAVLHMAAQSGVDTVSYILNHQSGFIGLTGQSDLRQLQDSPDPAHQFALSHYIYWIARHSGSMVSAMGGLDAIAFTGGIGENSAKIRAAIIDRLAYLGTTLNPVNNEAHLPQIHAADSRVAVHIVPAQEELRLVKDAMEVLSPDPATD